MKFKNLMVCLLLTVALLAHGAWQLPFAEGGDFALDVRDGKTVMAVTFPKADKVEIYSETAPGEFKLEKTLAVAAPNGITAGDFDRDGKTDWAVVSVKRNLTLFLSGRPEGPLVSPHGGMRSYRTPAAGILDKMQNDFFFGAGAALWQLRKNRVLTYGTLLPSQGQAANSCMAFGDFDGDGHPDIAALERTAKDAAKTKLRIYYGPIMNPALKPDECARFSESEIPFRAGLLASGDLNQDGKDELAVSGSTQTLLKTSEGDRTIAQGGIVLIQNGFLVISGARGTYIYRGLAQEPVKHDKQSYQSCRIARGNFYGLRSPNMRIYEIPAAGPGAEPAAASPGAPPAAASRAVSRGTSGPAIPLLKPEFRYRKLAPQARTVAERLKNDPMMFPYYTGTILPTPQQARYSDKLFAIDKVGFVLGKELKADDARVKILRERIARYGGSSAVIPEAAAVEYPLCFAIGDTELAKGVEVPEKQESYAFKQLKPGLIGVRYHDRLALTWAMTSLAQLVGESGFRPADVVDYPKVARRGGSIPRIFDRVGNWSDYSSPELVNMAIYPKFNEFVFPYYLLIPNRGPDSYWRKARPQKYYDQLKTIADRLNPLGITWYAGLIAFGKRDSPHQQEWMLDSASDRDFQVLFDMACQIGDLGGNIFFYWEDHRKPIGAADKKNFGSAREADIFLINRLYTALRQKYPELKFQFAGPFYHGPEGAPSPFSDENRDDYFAGIGKRFPKDIDICWSGPRVASTRVTREHMQWITKLIQRKPAFWQNGADFGRRPRVFYMGDKLNAWKTFYYDGFYDDIASYYLNYSQPCLSHLCADFLWNPGAYDAEKSRCEVISRYVGPENFDLVMTMNKAMNAFNVHEFRVSPAAARSLSELKKNCLIAIDAYRKILDSRPATEILNMNFTRDILNRMIAFVNKLEDQKALSGFSAEAEAIRQAAVKEAGLDPRSDLLFTAFDINGSNPVKYKQRYRTKEYSAQKYCVVAFGKRTIFNTLSLDFTAIPWPAEDDYELIICGLDDDNPAPCPIRICVNGKEIYNGASPFLPNEWSVKKFRIPNPAIYRGNKVTIENLADSDTLTGPPFICVSYVILRKLDPQE